MQVVILAAGEGRRMRPLTNNTPKPLLEVGGKTLLEHKFDALPETVTEIILIVGYLSDQIKNYFGDTYKKIPIRYIQQDKPIGTAAALWLAKDHIDDRFLVMMGDDLYCKRDIDACLEHKWAFLVSKETYEDEMTLQGGDVVLDKDNHLKSITEGEHQGRTFVRGTNLFVLNPEIFSYILVPKAPGSSEFGLPQTIVTATSDIDIDIVEAHCWMPVTTPSDLEKAEEWVQNNG